ncbi:hypothetical protein [Hwangdonia seohaensis]|uniref:Galactose oxidase n=1 Tax=Hwangdonia seohaensis TaxID=1240727 RepID=A0ABW3R797_9FLAO|nr:hypothetical protein [Hwangdonia seohaensis]
MMKNIALIVISLILVNCNKDSEEPFLNEEPVIKTLQAISVDATGATFRGELVQKGEAKINAYGFVWSLWDFEEPNVNTSNKITFESDVSTGIFEARIDSLLASGFEYKIKTFASYGTKTIYGNTVSFMSKGSEKSIWSKELSNLNLPGVHVPYGFSDKENGYVLFQDTKTYKYNPNEKVFHQIASFPNPDGSSGTKFTAVHLNDSNYILNDIDTNLYELNENTWSVLSVAPFNYEGFGGYYHGYSNANNILILSSYKSFNYAPETDQWYSKSSLSAEGFSVGGTNLDGIAYIMTSRKKIYSYNSVDDTWDYVTEYPGVLKSNIIGFSYSNKIYFGFSYLNHEETPWIDQTFWSFDLTKRSWTQIAPLPKELSTRGTMFFFILKNKLFIGHGVSKYYDLYALDFTKL